VKRCICAGLMSIRPVCTCGYPIRRRNVARPLEVGVPDRKVFQGIMVASACEGCRACTNCGGAALLAALAPGPEDHDLAGVTARELAERGRALEAVDEPRRVQPRDARHEVAEERFLALIDLYDGAVRPGT
jgi:hypothetical protein